MNEVPQIKRLAKWLRDACDRCLGDETSLADMCVFLAALNKSMHMARLILTEHAIARQQKEKKKRKRKYRKRQDLQE